MPTPDLSNYYGKLTTNHDYRIQAKVVVWVTVGKGSFSTLNPTQLAFSGHYSVAGHSGSVDISLTVTGENTGTFNLNGHSGDCTFKEDGKILYVYFYEGSKRTYIEVQYWDNGLWVGGEASPYNIWIGP